MKKLSKKGSVDFLSSKVVFIVLVLIFVGIVSVFLFRVSRGVTLTEQTYAKRIALLIDQAKPGTIIELNLDEAFKLADKNEFDRGSTVVIDNEKRTVTVRLTEGKGYSYGFFTDSSILWGVDKISGLKIQVT